jgi:hypothetical protein
LPDRGPAVPLKRTWEASVLGLPNERFFPAAGAGPLEQEFAQAFMREAALKGVKSPFDLLDCGVGIEKQTRRVSDNRVEAADRVAEGKKDRYRSGTGTSTLAG